MLSTEFSCLTFYQSWLNTIRSIGICLTGYMMQLGRVGLAPPFLLAEAFCANVRDIFKNVRSVVES